MSKTHYILISAGVGVLFGVFKFFWWDKTRTPNLTDYQLWCIGLSGILTEMNCNNHFVLDYGRKNKHKVTELREMLEEWWGIYNRNDLLKTLTPLFNAQMHNDEFQDYAQVLAENDGLSEEELTELYPENDHKLKFVLKHYKTVGDRYIKAWDYGRYVFLCRNGYTCAYLSREETLSLIEKMGERVAKEFNSWEEFGENYIIGRVFWALGDPEGEKTVYEEAWEAYETLLSEGGAWTEIPWKWSNRHEQCDMNEEGLGA